MQTVRWAVELFPGECYEFANRIIVLTGFEREDIGICEGSRWADWIRGHA